MTTAVVPIWTQSQDLKNHLAGFLVGYPVATRKNYAEGMKAWILWCNDREIDVFTVSRAYIELYGRWMEEERQLAPSSVLHWLCVLRSWYRYLEEEGVIEVSPARKIRLPKVSSDSNTKGLTRAELSKLLAISEYNPVYHAMFCLLTLNGLRISEACGALIEDMSVERGHRTLTVTRKGGKRQTLPLSPKTVRALDHIIGERISGLILLSGLGNPMTRTNAAKAVARIGKRAGVESRVHPHRLRHAFVTTALDAGVPLHDVQDSAGHADPRTTMRYNRNRFSLDRNATHIVTAFVSGG